MRGWDHNKESALTEYLLRTSSERLLDIAKSPDSDRHYGVPLSLAALACEHPEAVDMALRDPMAFLTLCDAACLAAQRAVIEGRDERLILKSTVHARPTGLAYYLSPTASHCIAPPPDGLRAAHAHRLVTVKGVVIRTNPLQLLESRRLYECSRCRHRFVVAADLELGGAVDLPQRCPRPEACPSTSFRHCEEVAMYTNLQEIILRPTPEEESRASSMGVGLTVILQDDLADCLSVGQHAEITGIVLQRFDNGFCTGARCHAQLALFACSVQRAPHVQRNSHPKSLPSARQNFASLWRKPGMSPWAVRDSIIAAVCPQLQGMFSAKLAALLLLLSGGHETHRTRTEIHLLLVGDPGTGKSQLQRWVAQLAAPKSVLTSGRSSSAAGLTAAAVRKDGRWGLEPGALVLASGGVACIDEFDSIKSTDASSLLEAMEQQTVSIAKAGLSTTLATNTSVFATCNPRGHSRYDPRKPLIEQLDVPTPLLSRFDIILLLTDTPDAQADSELAEYILKKEEHKMRQLRAVDDLSEYIEWAKETSPNPELSAEAEALLSSYYQALRQGQGRPTIRVLESGIRIARAHARLMAQCTIRVEDAVVAISLLESSGVLSLCQGTLPGWGASGGGALGRDGFPKDPETSYACLQASVFNVTHTGP